MKPLILSFFAVILGYSLFIDKDEEVKLSTPARLEPAPPELSDFFSPMDTIEFYANKSREKAFIY